MRKQRTFTAFKYMRKQRTLLSHIFKCSKTTENFAENPASGGGLELFSAGGSEFKDTPLLVT